jgi:hypothetical protein
MKTSVLEVHDMLSARRPHTLVVAVNALVLKRTKLAGIRQPGKTAAA